MVYEDAVDLGPERRQIAQVLHADRAPAHLVLVRGPDAAPRGADLAGARRLLADDVELAVQGQDQRGVIGDAQFIAADDDAMAGELVDLGTQRPRIDDDTIADDAELARANDARGQQRKLVGIVADDERMTGVVAALEAHDDVGALRQPVHDLALALVAPLGADHRDIPHLLARLAAKAPV